MGWGGRSPGGRTLERAHTEIMSERVDVPCRWQFMSDGSDIGFGIFLKTKMGERQKAGEMTEVLPNQRYNAHLVPEDGSLTCSEPGICKYLCLGLKPLPQLCEAPLSPDVRTRSEASSIQPSPCTGEET